MDEEINVLSSIFNELEIVGRDPLCFRLRLSTATVQFVLPPMYPTSERPLVEIFSRALTDEQKHEICDLEFIANEPNCFTWIDTIRERLSAALPANVHSTSEQIFRDEGACA
jgi:hypothetical protein